MATACPIASTAVPTTRTATDDVRAGRLLARGTTLAALCSAFAAASIATPARADWAGAWAAAAQDFAQTADAGGPNATLKAGQTLRQRVHPLLSGSRMRVRFSNAFGQEPLHIASASVARSTGGDAISPGTLEPLRFDNGRPDIVIAPGQQAWSDEVAMPTDPRQPLAVTFHLDRNTPARTVHRQPSQATWIADAATPATPKFEAPQPAPWNHIVTGIDVQRAPSATRVVVAFGDSITEGTGTTEDLSPRPYPERLAARLRDGAGADTAVSVLNLGIGGNRLLADRTGPSGLSRFGRDVLAQSGVTHALILIGINDIGVGVLSSHLPASVTGGTATAEQLIAGLQQLTAQARARGVKVLLGTLLPMKGSGYWNEESEARRQAVNRWIRGRQGVDGVIDFDAAMRDEKDHQALNRAYDSGDHLHPNDAGNAAMAAAVDLRELRE